MKILDKLFNREQHFEKCFNLRFPGAIIDRDINILKTDKELLEKIGKAEKITKSGKNSLLIMAKNQEQANKLLSVKKLDNKPVTVESHRKFNGAKGVIRSRALGQSTDEELTEHLQGQGVKEVRRVKIKRDSTLIETNTYIITFSSSECPRAIKFTDWHYEKIEEFKHRPQQCFKCQKFGHVAKYCRSEENVCSKCGQVGHEKLQCDNDVFCYHCSGLHMSSSRECPK